MQKINIPFLVSRLYSTPTNEFQSGFNSALIVLLKTQIEDVENELDVTLRHGFAYLFSKEEISSDKYISLSREQKDSIYQALRNGAKLTAVKYMKEFTGMGLKESKDVVDLFSRNSGIYGNLS